MRRTLVMGKWERGLGRWINVAKVRRAASTVVAARAPSSSSAAVLAGVGSALGAGFLWAATAKPALAEEDGKGKKDKTKRDKVRSALCAALPCCWRARMTRLCAALGRRTGTA